MKKRIFTIVTIICAVCFGANAQNVRFGAKGGINIGDLSFSDFTVNVGGISYTQKVNTGIQASVTLGAFARYYLAKRVSVEGGLAYSRQGAKIESVDRTANAFGLISATTNQKIDEVFVFDQLNIPFWVKYSFKWVRPKVGIIPSILLSAKCKQNNVTRTISPDKRLVFALGEGIEYQLTSRIFLDVNYNFGLSKIGSDVLGEVSTDVSQRVFQVGLGYWF